MYCPGRFSPVKYTHYGQKESAFRSTLTAEQVATICANRYITYMTECLVDYSRENKATEVCFVNTFHESMRAYMANRLFFDAVRRKVIDILYEKGYCIAQWIPTNIDGVFNLRLSWDEPQDIGF